MTYDDASTWAEDINRVVSANIMPPWKPVPGHGHGEFKDSYGLSGDERQTSSIGSPPEPPKATRPTCPSRFPIPASGSSATPIFSSR